MAKQKWEYAFVMTAPGQASIKVVLPNKNPSSVPGDLPTNLNKLGVDYWELVSTALDGQTMLFIMKRPA